MKASLCRQPVVLTPRKNLKNLEHFPSFKDNNYLSISTYDTSLCYKLYSSHLLEVRAK